MAKQKKKPVIITTMSPWMEAPLTRMIYQQNDQESPVRPWTKVNPHLQEPKKLP